MDTHSPLSLYSVDALIILDSDGKRILAKYFTQDYKSAREQTDFEKQLFKQTKKLNNELIMYEGKLVIYQNIVDVFIYVIANQYQNELMLCNFMTSFIDALNILLKNQVEKRVIMDNMDVVFLCIDECLDEGIILDNDATQISSRVSKKANNGDTMNLSEQSFTQAFFNARDQIARSLLK
ncbi:snare-like protein [Piromyces finnis]|uniref:Coatomer subunit zeta n=1 Tax=Piromyces finnis TaxID=1754191 RepID=A0A1Y1V9R3_9FUNG|nr:snare-like protein [Piromyces finnis]|eukprot:ORX50701.1 snare-like protein [Piromyces finnis]